MMRIGQTRPMTEKTRKDEPPTNIFPIFLVLSQVNFKVLGTKEPTVTVTALYWMGPV